VLVSVLRDFFSPNHYMTSQSRRPRPEIFYLLFVLLNES